MLIIMTKPIKINVGEEIALRRLFRFIHESLSLDLRNCLWSINPAEGFQLSDDDLRAIFDIEFKINNSDYYIQN